MIAGMLGNSLLYMKKLSLSVCDEKIPNVILTIEVGIHLTGCKHSNRLA